MADKKEIVKLLRQKIAEDKIYFKVIKEFRLPSENAMIYPKALILLSSINLCEDINTSFNISVIYERDDTPITWFDGFSLISYELMAELIMNGYIVVINSRKSGFCREIMDLVLR